MVRELYYLLKHLIYFLVFSSLKGLEFLLGFFVYF